MKIKLTATAIFFLFFLPSQSRAQRFLMDMVDTTNQMGKGMLGIYERYNRVKLSGYIQPQFQFTSAKGAETYVGPNFADNANNRFMIRRGRLRVDYAHMNKKGQPTSYFVFQFDGSERGVAIRDFWGRFYENRFKLFALTTGVFARPFGHEINLSSSNRESPERGRMSQILMKTERDIGAMLTVSSRTSTTGLSRLKLDLGVFNGQGLAGPVDYDSHKDVIGRISLKPTTLQDKNEIILSAGISGYLGGITSQGTEIYRTQHSSNHFQAIRDSSAKNINKISPREYLGADLQLKVNPEPYTTELRAEYMFGKQTGTQNSSESPGEYPMINNIKAPLYIRNFNGAYFYLIQNLGNDDHQLIFKYDWYDPNRKVKGADITAERGFSAADIRYDTFGLGYLHRANRTLKFIFYYDMVRNESTALQGYAQDLSDNVFTCRVQYNF
ncbi:porin [Dyadobacter tibetensis]|uniref:porin n=1 Tax=Dyadobacter tibetensis TaxID=1211851 RepID=UPI0004BC51F4|nr:porin [Dyadobacter tibetensis]